MYKITYEIERDRKMRVCLLGAGVEDNERVREEDG